MLPQKSYLDPIPPRRLASSLRSAKHPNAQRSEVAGSGISTLFTKLLMKELPVGREMSFRMNTCDCGAKFATVSGGFAKLARTLPDGQMPPTNGCAHTNSPMRAPPVPL